MTKFAVYHICNLLILIDLLFALWYQTVWCQLMLNATIIIYTFVSNPFLLEK